MEPLKVFKLYLEQLYEIYSRRGGRHSYKGKIINIEEGSTFDKIYVKFSDPNIKFQVSSKVVIENTDGFVESFQGGIYTITISKEFAFFVNMDLEVSSASDLLFLVENMMKTLELLSSKEELADYRELINDLYASKVKSEWIAPHIKSEKNGKFTESQSEVIASALNLMSRDKGILLVEGPGGTGKTECIAEISRSCIKDEKRVLICSSTNLSIDNVLSKLVDEEDILRIGSESSIERAEVKKFSIRNKLTDKIDYKTLFENSKIIGSTIDSVGIHLKKIQFDLVIIDEASTVELPKLLIALLKSKRIMICGDTKQLGQFIEFNTLRSLSKTISGEGLNLLQKSPFSLISKFWEKESNVLYLNDNFRNPKRIFDFINKNFYNGRMNYCAKKNFEKVKPKKLADIINADELSWIVPHRSELEEENIGIFDAVKTTNSFSNSYYNLGNLSLTILFLKALLKKYDPHSIGIISPFNAQATMLREFIAKYPDYILNIPCNTDLERTKLSFYLLNSINVNTINKFQGQERDVIIFDITSNADFIFDDARKLNVVLGRAKEQILIIGLPPRHEKFQKLLEFSKLFGDIEISDSSLAFIIDEKDISEFNTIKAMAQKFRNSKFVLRDIETYLGQQLAKAIMIDEKYSKDINNFMLRKDLDTIIVNTLRNFFSLGKVSIETYDLLEQEIKTKISAKIERKKLGPLFGYN